MIDYTQIENDLKQWIRTVCGFGGGFVISQNDNNPRPLDQYATVKIYDAQVIGHDTFNATAAPLGTVDLNYSGVRKIRIGVNIFRDGTETVQNQMAKLTSSFNRFDTQIYFKSKNMGIIESGEVIDLPELVRDKWEERKQCDFFVYVNDEETQNVEAIEKLAGTGFGTAYQIP